MSQAIRIGIVGAGGVASWGHIPGYKAQKDAEIVAICDVIPGQAAKLAEENGIPHAYTSYAEMFASEKLDAISVCTPNVSHKEISVAALNAGMHVLCEKPMAMNLAEGKEMVAAAKKAGKVLQIGLHWRFTSEGQTLKRFIEAG